MFVGNQVFLLMPTSTSGSSVLGVHFGVQLPEQGASGSLGAAAKCPAFGGTCHRRRHSVSAKVPFSGLAVYVLKWGHGAWTTS